MLDKTVSISSVPDTTFSKIASNQIIERTAKALESNGIRVLIVQNGEETKRLFFELIPEGAEVFLGASVTLEQLGVKDEIDKSGHFDAIRPKMFAMNRETPRKRNS